MIGFRLFDPTMFCLQFHQPIRLDFLGHFSFFFYFSDCAVGDQWMCDTVASIYHATLMPSGQYEALSEMVKRGKIWHLGLVSVWDVPRGRQSWPGEFNMSWHRPALSSLLRVSLTGLIATVWENMQPSQSWPTCLSVQSEEMKQYSRARTTFSFKGDSCLLDIWNQIWALTFPGRGGWCTLYGYIIQKRRLWSCLIASHFYHHIVSGFSFVTHKKSFSSSAL